MCECGCGAMTIKRFVSGHNLRNQVKSDEHKRKISIGQKAAWDRGRTGGGSKMRRKVGDKIVDSNGYVLIKTEPSAHMRDWPREHTVVMESLLGRKLRRGEIVHHINGNRADNRAENLYLSPSRAAHNDIHRSLESVTYQLIVSGVIVFNEVSGTYEAIL